MSTSKYEHTIYAEVTYVRGGDIRELRAACIAHDFKDGATWRVEDDAVVFSLPMGEQLIAVENGSKS